ncbi:MAG: PilN domain-containing protein [Candidatus Accumulibacter sp.]|jgi:type IV pilus assembly protein PilN|nr:PilN domain-containing protein [Accumulibacter sp.]
MTRVKINLLPYREGERKARRQQFYGLFGLVAILAGLIVFAMFTVIDGYVVEQTAKNDFIKKEIAALDKEIDEIKRLQEQTRALLARKQIIESLQQNRAEAVLLLSELAKQMPDGVYLRSLKQNDTIVNLLGYAQSSSTRVPTLMRNIEASPWLEKPELREVKAVTLNNNRLNEFNMNVTIKRTSNEEAGKK